MAQAFYEIGERRGPFLVTESHFDLLPNGEYLEVIKDEIGNSSMTLVKDEPREYVKVCEREGNVLVPYTVKHPFTEQGLDGMDASWIDVSHSPYDYWRALCDWWSDYFTIIEHDVRANRKVFYEFYLCPEAWCTFRYSNFSDEDAEAWHYGILGCTRFRREIIDAVPNALIDLEWRFRDWHHVSTGLGKTLREAGFEPHVHGIVDHHRMMDVGGVTEAMK
jgi:hypothetical protein